MPYFCGTAYFRGPLPLATTRSVGGLSREGLEQSGMEGSGSGGGGGAATISAAVLEQERGAARDQAAISVEEHLQV